MPSELMKPPPATETEIAHPGALPDWARDLVALYESGAANGFVLYGNVDDRMILPVEDGQLLGTNDE